MRSFLYRHKKDFSSKIRSLECGVIELVIFLQQELHRAFDIFCGGVQLVFRIQAVYLVGVACKKAL